MAMALKADSKVTFEPARVIQPVYTGGSVALSSDGKTLATCVGEEVLLTSLESGEQLARIEGDGEAVTTIALTPDATWLVVCSRSLSMRLYALQATEDGVEPELARTLKPHTTPAVTAAVDATHSLLATGGADGTVKVWDLRGGYTTHTFHGHNGVVSALLFFQVDPAIEQKQPKSKKRKSRDMEEVQNDATAGFRLASGGEDGHIRIWDLYKRRSVVNLEAHASVVRSLDFSAQRNMLLSASRDKTAIMWDARTWEAASTIPVLEGIEKAGFTDDGRYFFTGGETARLRIWNAKSGEEITEEQVAGSETEAILDVLYQPGMSFLLSVHADQTLVLHSLQPLGSSPSSLPHLPVLRRISGTHDEVIDLAYIGKDRNVLAIATNLEELRLVSVDAQPTSPSAPYFGADLAVLKSHTEIIITLSIDWSGHWLATGSKDNTAKLWRLDPENSSYTCWATFTGHAESIGAVSLPSVIPQVGTKEYDHPLAHPPKFLITGSQDKTVKRWTIPKITGETVRTSVYTRKAHEKDINALATSYHTIHSSTLFASASQDRTCKIWSTESGEAVGVLRGHKRGVWSVAFSPPSTPALTTNEAGAASGKDGMVVTGSGDRTVRVWSLGDYSCLRVLEGGSGSGSILKVVWLPPVSSKQRDSSARVASAGGDGLVRIWDAQDGEAVATLDNHIDRVWALAVRPPPRLSSEAQKEKDDKMVDDDEEEEDDERQTGQLELVSGSADSTLTFWHDTTQSTTQKTLARATARVEQDQELQNHIRSANYREAIVLALQLNHPKRLLDLFTAVVNGARQARSLTGRQEVDDVLAGLSDDQLWALLRRIRDWNANARTHNVAQHILHAVLRLHSKERILGLKKRRRTAEAAVDGELADAMAQLNTDDGGSKGVGKESVKDVLDALKAYTERHQTRLEKMSDERYMLVWALQQMDDLGGGGALTNGYANGQRGMIM